MSVAAVECSNLYHEYDGKPALRGVSWKVMPGRICGLLGRNGAGKSTTINILNSFITPSSGGCYLLGEASHQLTPATKARIGYLIEGHVQYGFFNVDQIEKFYAGFYPRWDPAVYFHLIQKLDISRKQKISSMSCGQRSQVALGLLLAQQPDLIIFDDYSLGLDPGYRHLFIDVIKEFAADGRRTILLTSHIIQDLEDLIDDCLIYQRGTVLVDMPTSELRSKYRCYAFQSHEGLTEIFEAKDLVRLEHKPDHWRLYGFLQPSSAIDWLERKGVRTVDLKPVVITLEEAFIAMTGKY